MAAAAFPPSSSKQARAALSRLSAQACRDAAETLARLDADWAGLVAAVGPCRLQAGPAQQPCEALVRAVAYQQLHAKAGDAILARLQALYPGDAFPSPAQLAATDPQQLRARGFSAGKLAAIQGIAQATLDGLVPGLDEALGLPDAELIARLVTLRGVGRWTVEMFLIYSLGRIDVLPADDFGVREGYRRLKRLPKALTPSRMRDVGQSWRPFRTVAAWYLWRAPALGSASTAGGLEAGDETGHESTDSPAVRAPGNRRARPSHD